MKILQEHTSFTIHPAAEFIYGLNFIANEEALRKFYTDYDFTPSESFLQLLEDIKSRISRFLKSELTYFFDWPDMIHILGRVLLEDVSIRQVSAFIARLEQMSEKKFCSYVLYQSLYGINGEDMEEADPDNLQKLLSSADHKSDEVKEKLAECLQNPSEFKARLCFVLSQFYKNCYEPLEESILSQSLPAKEHYERLFAEDPDYFNNEFFGKALDMDFEEFIVHISYFTQIRAWMFDVRPQSGIGLISLGIHSEHYPRKVFIKAKVQRFVKLLSDKKRFEIMERLGKRPHYVHELSSELKLTPPTVCYHLNAILDLNLVSTNRENNKTFYTLNKAAVKELLDNAREVLLDNEE